MVDGAGISDATYGRKSARVDYIDWLRAFALLFVVLYHAARIFDGRKNFVSDEPHIVFLGLEIFIEQWIMPLFFLLAGASTWFALEFRTWDVYAKERTLRLLVPLFFGTVVLIPPCAYCRALGDPTFHLSFIQYYPEYFDDVYPKGDLEWRHLWFLAYLFIFSMVTLPLFLRLKKEAGEQLIGRLADFSEKRGAIFLFSLPVIVGEVCLRARWPTMQNFYEDWANNVFFIAYFIFGFMFSFDERFGKAIDRHARLALGMGLITMSVYLGLELTAIAPPYEYSPAFTLHMILRGFNSWLWVVALLGFGRKYLGFTNGVLKYAREATMPLYVLHETAVVVIGYHVIKWDLGVTGKFLFIYVTALVATVVCYDLFVRRTNPTRFLFGMRPK